MIAHLVGLNLPLDLGVRVLLIDHVKVPVGHLALQGRGSIVRELKEAPFVAKIGGNPLGPLEARFDLRLGQIVFGAEFIAH